MKKSISGLFTVLTAIILFFQLISCNESTDQQMYYEIKIYSVPQPGQAESMDKYLADALIPALHRAGINNVGAFKPIAADTARFGKFVYLFIPYETADKYINLVTLLENDTQYQQAGKDFLDAPVDNPPFARYESIFMKAFKGMPALSVPSFNTPRGDRIYELRDYESATETKAAKKRDMFNSGEMDIFKKLGCNAVFYGQVLAGSNMPDLMYMTTYQDMKTHDEKWAAFRIDPDWVRMRGMEEYKNTTSKTTPFLLFPTDYSDF
ncbi:MAG TPA: NIPSNAP family protein [Bacteroidales bacterium]|jgi:hypothetical protein|nr:NIPSNAP family protein [Bacteroidales bacterium]HOX73913.1 NIPSNAP family protein [Bacteroidales bacterium]HPM87458.1 NIPSNAP family protein [Bacteroidales bacterium]HQM70134.1 NIPSNAP family protein [Bacteroidales bacterium]